jgi:hypothetical protein
MHKRALVLVTLLSIVLSQAACGTVYRFEPLPLRHIEGGLVPTTDPRIHPDDAERLLELRAAFSSRLAEEHSAGTVLALSGGGANGAFGAGILVGWSETGTRPEFDIVTGISTGALSAPFAFLGPDWDDELQEAYTGGGAEGILNFRGLSALVSPSLYSSAPLRRLINDNVTPELLREIAVEHAKGRRLLVVTTNLDTKESVIWDMGQLATQGDDQALALFRQVLLASASIPGVFPPVMIAALSDGQVIAEMHVDGAINLPFLAIPEGLQVDSPPRLGLGRPAIYVIMNGQIDRDAQVTPGRLRAIVMRTYDSMSRATTQTHLTANAAYAERHRIDLRVAAIPIEARVSSMNFDQAAMTAVFEMGRGLAANGHAWRVLNAAPDEPETAPP